MLSLQNERYTLDGVDVVDLCSQFGTPLYVYSAETMTKKYNAMIHAFTGLTVRVNYACKALTSIAVLKHFKDLGSGLDTVSIQEVQIGLKAGFEPNKIIFTPNCVSFEEIKEAVELGVHINIDDLSVLDKFGAEYGSSVPVCIRFNPHILAGGNPHIQVGHIDSKFGISIYQVRHLLRITNNHSIKVNGIHMHTGSDILDPQTFLRGAEILFDTAKNFPDLEFIDFGSGFKVPYKEEDVATDIADFGARMTKEFKQFCEEYGRELEIWFEPGKYLVSESGYFFVKTNVVKQTISTLFAGVDSGQNHLIRPMFYDAYHKIVNVSNPSGSPRVYSVVGYICETDTFGWDRKISEVREDDILCMFNAGAYGMSMSSNYNSRLRPAEVFIENGEARLIRRRETLDDILQTQML